MQLRSGKVFGIIGMLAACASNEPVSTASQAVMDDMGMDCEGGRPEAIMQVGDFNGDGRISSADVNMLSEFKDSGQYAAFFDMNADGVLNGKDVSAVAKNMRRPGTVRDAQMAALWRTTAPYRDIRNAQADGYTPFTPDLMGHGIHYAKPGRILQRFGGAPWDAAKPEGLNYTADGRLVAAFYYAPGAIRLDDGHFQELASPASFDGIDDDMWHDHIGACFGRATSPLSGFNQCMTQSACLATPGPTPTLLSWSPGFHMLHVWLFEYNACGPFAGLDEDVSQMAPMEPNHGACTIADVVGSANLH